MAKVTDFVTVWQLPDERSATTRDCKSAQTGETSQRAGARSSRRRGRTATEPAKTRSTVPRH